MKTRKINLHHLDIPEMSRIDEQKKERENISHEKRFWGMKSSGKCQA